MDCHRCIHVRYDGCRYGRCSHSGHKDVKLSKRQGGERKYNKQICPDFRLRKRCSNCRYWIRGKYFSDGATPATKGKCSLRILREAEDCPMWKAGPTSSKKRKGKGNG